MTTKAIAASEYVDLSEGPNFLRIYLTETGREELEAQRDGMGWKWGTIYVFQALLEDWLGNGWEWVKPEDIGALTSAPILRSPNGMIYWFPNYAITCEIEEMLATGHVDFVEAES